MKRKDRYVCSQTHVIEGVSSPKHNYDSDKPLQQCARCENIYYVNREAQRTHWRLHKSSCRSTLIPDEKLKLDRMNLDQSYRYLRKSFINNGGDFDSSYVINRIRMLFDEGDRDPKDVEVHLHTLARNIIFVEDDAIILRIFACPGMTVLFLTGDDLLNDYTRKSKELLVDFNGIPSDDYITFHVSEIEGKQSRVRAAKAEVQKERDKLGIWSPSSTKFAYFYFSLVVAAAVDASPSPISTNDGYGNLRGYNPNDSTLHSLTIASCRRAMELWTDPYVRESCNDALAPAPSMAISVVKHYARYNIMGKRRYGCSCSWSLSATDDDDYHVASCDDNNDDDTNDSNVFELIPGLTLFKTIVTCLSEMTKLAGNLCVCVELINLVLGLVPQKSLEHHEEICHQKYLGWHNLSIQKRAGVALAVVAYFLQHGTIEAEGAHSGMLSGKKSAAPVPIKTLINLLENSCGGKEIHDSTGAVRLAVWNEASANETLGPNAHGHNTESRAFFHYLIRRLHASSKKNKTGGLNESSKGRGVSSDREKSAIYNIDMFTFIENWRKEAFPKRKKNKNQRPLSKLLSEKVACMGLAQGRDLHLKWKKQLKL